MIFLSVDNLFIVHIKEKGRCMTYGRPTLTGLKVMWQRGQEVLFSSRQTRSFTVADQADFTLLKLDDIVARTLQIQRRLELVNKSEMNSL